MCSSRPLVVKMTTTIICKKCFKEIYKCGNKHWVAKIVVYCETCGDKMKRTIKARRVKFVMPKDWSEKAVYSCTCSPHDEFCPHCDKRFNKPKEEEE